MKKTLKYSMFAMIYFSQGAIMSFFTALNALYLQSFGLGMGKIGIIGTIGMIPFVIKILFGMLSDKVNFFGLGNRKPYILIGLAIQAFSLIAAPMIDPGEHFWAYALLAFVMMTGMALYDTCTDGLALDTTPEEEEGLIQGFMVGGRAVGMVVVSVFLGLIVQNISWRVGFYFLAVVTILPLPMVFQFRVSDAMPDKLFDWKAFRCFRQPRVISLGLLGALYSLIIYSANQLVNPYLSESISIDFSTAGFMATVMGIGIVVGGLVGGGITSKIGQKKSVQAAMVLSIISIGALAAITNLQLAWILVVVFGFAFGFYETVFFAISMRVPDERIAATMFSILMAVANIGTGIGLGITGGLSEKYGFRITFIILAALNILAFPLLHWIFSGRSSIEGE